MRQIAALVLFAVLGVAACTAAVTTELQPSTLNQLQQLEHKPELYVSGPNGDCLITADTQVEIVLTNGNSIVVYAAEVLTSGSMVILRGRAQSIPMSEIEKVRYTSKY